MHGQLSNMSKHRHTSTSFADPAETPDVVTEVRREAALLKTGALQNAIFNSANFSSIATDEKGVIQLFNVGAERMLELILLIILLLVFGGGGGYYGYNQWGAGGGLGVVLLVVLLLVLFGRGRI